MIGGIRLSAIQIQGLKPLNGSIEIQGSKNAVLPMMAAALLAAGVTVIHHVPAIEDVWSMMGILDSLGCVCSLKHGVLTVDASGADGHRIPEEYVGKMRSSCLLLGPLLGRMGEAVTYYPGGCVLGKRPIDFHINALKLLGAEFFEAGGMILSKAERLRGADIVFPYPSVGATENAVMAAVTAEGTTVLSNCAREPEIVELCRLLSMMGARIRGAGKSRMVIEGVKELHPAEYVLSGDRICAGTYLMAAMVTAGDVAVRGAEPGSLREPVSLMRRMGAEVSVDEREKEIRLRMKKRPEAFSVSTGPYPEFPTDLQSVFLAAACIGQGESRITETVFEARFAAAALMERFGANIRVENRTAVIRGKYPLKPAVAKAPDLRGGAALILAALAADGLSVIGDCGHIMRGHEDICRDLENLGAEITWIHM